VRILIVGLNYAPEQVGIAVYTTGMAEALALKGHEVRVVAGQPYYPGWRIMAGFSAWSWSKRTENGVTITRVPHYIPNQPTGKKRVIHHATFAASSLLPALWQGAVWRPDVVLAVAPSLIGAPVARLAAFFAGARNWLHIQDFEVEAAFAAGLLKQGARLEKLARGFERWVLGSFDRVSAISPEMCRRLVAKGVPNERVTEFRNWADVDAIRPSLSPSPYRDLWNIETPHVALYSGNIANKQGIEVVIEAARLLEGRRDLTFVICGDGPKLGSLRELAEGLSNVQFRDLQPKERLNDLMGLATIHLLPQLAGAADLVLPSKLANMLASGRPVIATAMDGTGLARELDGCGEIVSPEDPQALASAVSSLLDDAQKRHEYGIACRKRADDAWAKDNILDGFADRLLRLAADGGHSTRVLLK
jgi:colanic acid biosynthesis glycosyl transferase WcaI